jgi:hypothetical protein
MFKVTRKWERESDQAPPCQGNYVYSVTWGDLDYYDMSAGEYRDWKATIIKETWKKA